MNIVVGGAAGRLGLVDGHGLGIGQTMLGIDQVGLQFFAQLAGLVTGLAGSNLEQFFSIGDDYFEVGDQLVIDRKVWGEDEEVADISGLAPSTDWCVSMAKHLPAST